MSSHIVPKFDRSMLVHHRRQKNYQPLLPQNLLVAHLVTDQNAWPGFVHQFQPLIATVIVKTLRHCVHPNPSLVDDLVQETYLKLCANDFKALREFECRHEQALPGFLKVIASNVAQDYLRKLLCPKRGSGKVEGDIETAVPARGYVANAVARMDRTILVNQIAHWLRRQCRQATSERDCKIFWLYYWQGLTAQAISCSPGIDLTVKGVESALFRLTALVRHELNRKRRRNLHRCIY